jgi:tetratricopeptide (TPR) repeat protein
VAVFVLIGPTILVAGSEAADGERVVQREMSPERLGISLRTAGLAARAELLSVTAVNGAATAPIEVVGAQQSQFAPPAILLAQAEGGPAPDSPEARYEAAFEAMMQDLSNPERSFEFAEAAVEVGDVRGAIAALERILLLNPNLPNIALELGILYQRVGNNALAAQYLEQALTAEQVPEPIRQRAEDMLAVAEAAVSRHQFHGSLFAGMRFETNSNAAPEGVRLAGQPDLRPDEPERDDISGLGSAALEYDYLLDSQAGNAIETNALLFAQRYARSQELDTELVDIDVGPRLHLGRIASPLISVRPFARAAYVRLDDETYLWRYGGGVEAEKTLSPRLFADGSLAVVYQDFSDTEEEPFASDRSGIQVEADAGLAYLLRATTTLSGRLDYTRRDADEGFEAFHAVGLTLAATERYNGPFQIVDEPWSATLSGAVEYSAYDDPDPQIDPDEEQEDWRFDVALTTSIPLTQSVSFVTTGRYTNVESTLPNEEYDNFALTLGVGWRF